MNAVHVDPVIRAVPQESALVRRRHLRTRPRSRGVRGVLAVCAPRSEYVLRETLDGRWPKTIVNTFVQASQALKKRPEILVLDGRLSFDTLFGLSQLARKVCCGRLAILLLLDPTVHIGQLDLLDVDMVLPSTHDKAEMHWWLTTLTRTQTFRAIATQEAIQRLLDATAEKDTVGDGHLQRIERYALAVGHVLELSPSTLRALRYGALLHDIGKVGISDAVLSKPARLNESEYQHVQHHSLIGEKVIQRLNLDPLVGKIVRHHHERWDGKGYPNRLKGTEIPLCARIVAVVDAFDAMKSQRPYNTPYSFDVAIETLHKEQGTCWDPTIVALFTNWLETSYRPRQRYEKTVSHPHMYQQMCALQGG